MNFRFGIDQYEKGKISEISKYRKEVWSLACEQSKDKKTACSLERLVIDNLDQSMGSGAYVSTHKHGIEDENLVLKAVSLEKGILDFSFAFTDGARAEVRIRMTNENGNLYLKEFNALTISHGALSDTMESVEYRIPKYSSTFKPAIEFRGYKSKADKELDDAISLLSPADQSVWGKKTNDELAKIFDNDFLKTQMKSKIPDYEAINSGKKEPTPEALEIMEACMNESCSNWLKSSGLSTDGQTKMLAYFKKATHQLILQANEEKIKARKEGKQVSSD